MALVSHVFCAFAVFLLRYFILDELAFAGLARDVIHGIQGAGVVSYCQSINLSP